MESVSLRIALTALQAVRWTRGRAKLGPISRLILERSSCNPIFGRLRLIGLSLRDLVT